MALKLVKKTEPVSNDKWFNFDKDTKILLAPIDTPEYQIALERARRRLRRNDEQFTEGTVGVVSGEKTEHQNHCMLLSHFILKDWDGAQDDEGNPLKYTPAIGAEMLDGNVDFFIFVLKNAAEFAAENKGELAETVEKPSTGSTGKGSGAGKRRSAEPSTNA
jgi:hypothetical protein